MGQDDTKLDAPPSRPLLKS